MSDYDYIEMIPHDLLVTMEGMTSEESKTKGAGLEIGYGFHETPFGECLIGVASRGICYLAFINKNRRNDLLRDLENKWSQASLKNRPRLTGEVVEDVFKRKRNKRLSVLLSGSAFQLSVWRALLEIPAGKILSYGDVATALGKPGASRAVGSALARNPVAYLIPCHRVIRKTGEIGDYHWGKDRKRAILSWES